MILNNSSEILHLQDYYIKLLKGDMKILVVSDLLINFTMPAFVIVSSVYNEVGVIINWQS